ncbi:MAG: hypothetical protein QOH71_2934 [Blastocatellia bacterium]|jgi:hypothetical protein|nr:hypothetical protein [Blastocatellia bacterium]
MTYTILFDIAPDPNPGGAGVLLAVLLFVIGFIALLAAGLVVYLWYRKRSLRGFEMTRPDDISSAQPSNPNQL